MRRLLAVVPLLVLVSACVAAAPAHSPGPASESTARTRPTPASPPAAANPKRWSPAPVPTSVDGNRVISVSEAIAERDAGKLGSSAITLGGYWSVRNSMATCPSTLGPPSDLEWHCESAVAGITEQYEA